MSTEASVDSNEPGSVRVRYPSSNWFGVMMSSTGITRSLMSGGREHRRVSQPPAILPA